MPNPTSIKVRFAPSPTGELHLGGARTALFNWLYAKKHQGSFFLRIEDTDKERSKDIFTNQILDSLKWLGLDWDEPLVYQSGRMDRYKYYLNKLLDENKAYRCFCSKSDVENYKKDSYALYPGTCRNLTSEEVKSKLNQGISFTIRIKLEEGITAFDDLVYGAINTNNKELDDFIIARSDGSPTYNFTVVVDDFEMEISHVIRGDDHLSNTPKQLILYESLELNPPIFAHLPMILGPDKKRLSKRHGAPGVQSFADQGYFPDSILNYLALLGWNPKSEKEVMLTDELINGFSFQQVQKKGAVWDDKKLHWLSGQHVQNKTSQLLLEEIRLLESDWGKNADISQLINIIDALKPRAKSLQEFILKSKFFFISPESFDESEMLKAWPNELTTEIVGEIEKVLVSVESWYPEILEKQLKSFATKNSYGVGKVIMPLRLAVFGSLDGPSVFDIMSILGKSETLNRIHSAISRMSK
ncbi:MAG: glutamate--tRNA ligase [Candidatus Neomarinimicrobiota bacterium]